DIILGVFDESLHSFNVTLGIKEADDPLFQHFNVLFVPHLILYAGIKQDWFIGSERFIYWRPPKRIHHEVVGLPHIVNKSTFSKEMNSRIRRQIKTLYSRGAEQFYRTFMARRIQNLAHTFKNLDV